MKNIRKCHIAIGLGIMAGGIFLLMTLSFTTLAGLLVILLLGIIVIRIISLIAFHRSQKIRLILLVALVLRLGIALFHVYIAPLPDSQYDGLAFEQVGWDFAQRLQEGLPIELPAYGGLYSAFIGFIYYIFGQFSFLIQLFNVLVGILIVFNIYRISVFLWGERFGQRAAWISTFFPTLILYATITRRETIILYFLTLSLYYLLKWYDKGEMKFFIFSSFIIFFGGILYNILTLGLIVHGYLVLKRWFKECLFRRHVKCCIKHTASGLLILIIIAGVLMSGIGFHRRFRNISTLDDVIRQQEYRTKGRAVYLENFTLAKPIDIIWQLPIRIIYFLFTPFPWMISSPADFIGFADVAFYIVLMICAWKRRNNWLYGKRALPLLLMFLVLVAIFAMGTSNYGTAIRHRVKIAPMLIILATAPLNKHRQPRFVGNLQKAISNEQT